MAKPTGKTKGGKTDNGGRKAKVFKLAKEKGQVPASYAQNHRRAEATRVQPLNNSRRRLIEQSVHRWADLADGVLGDYYVGSGGDSFMAVRVMEITGETSQPRIIRDQESGVFIPVFWMDICPQDCYFKDGYFGEKQREILGFLKQHLTRLLRRPQLDDDFFHPDDWPNDTLEDGCGPYPDQEIFFPQDLSRHELGFT